VEASLRKVEDFDSLYVYRIEYLVEPVSNVQLSNPVAA